MFNKKRYERMANQEREGSKIEVITQIHSLKEEVQSLNDKLQAFEFGKFEAEKIQRVIIKIFDQNIIDQNENPIFC